MATSDLKDLKIRLVFENGVDVEGNPQFEYKTYSYINMLATPDAILQSCEEIASLSSKPLYDIEKNEVYDINE